MLKIFFFAPQEKKSNECSEYGKDVEISIKKKEEKIKQEAATSTTIISHTIYLFDSKIFGLLVQYK